MKQSAIRNPQSAIVPMSNEDPFVALSNSSSDAPAFHITQPDSFFVPYGDFPHPLGMQHFDHAAANEMARQFDSFTGAVRRAAQNRSVTAFSLGAPIYIGHPDDPLKASKWPDKKAYGWVTGIKPMTNGCEFPIKWSDEGRDLITNAHFIFYSPFWDTTPVKNGYAPFRLRSIGLTNQPNIAVPPISNDGQANDANFDAAHLSTPVVKTGHDNHEEPNNDETMKIHPDLAKCLGLSDDASHEDALAAIEKLKAHKEPDADDKGGKPDGDADDKKKKKAEANDDTDSDMAASNDADAKLAEMQTLATSAKRNRIATAIDTAIAKGLLPIAEHGATVERLLALSNDDELTTQIHGILAAKPHLRMESKTGELAGAKDKVIAQSNDHARERDALVEAEIAKLKDVPESKRFETAWANVRRRKPSLFK